MVSEPNAERALGGSLAKKTSAASSSTSTSSTMVTAPATSITVTDAQAGLNPTPKPDPGRTAAAASSPISAPSTATEVTGVERSAVYKILPDNTVETLWTSKDENVYDIAAESASALTFLTDAQGRVYRLDPRPGRLSPIARDPPGEGTTVPRPSHQIGRASCRERV